MRAASAVLLLVLGSSLGADDRQPYRPTPDEVTANDQRALELPGRWRNLVYKATIVPHWYADGGRFWYRNDLRDGVKEFVRVHAEKGKREPAFDHDKLAAALSKAADKQYEAKRLPFGEFAFEMDQGEECAVTFRVGSERWRCRLRTYECEKPAVSDASEKRNSERFSAASLTAVQPPRRPDSRSPDGQWTAFVKEANVFARPESGEPIQLTKDGKSDRPFGYLSWSPTSRFLAVQQIEPGERGEVYLVESSPRAGNRAKLQTRPYPQPGDKFTKFSWWLIDLEAKKATKVDAPPVEFGGPFAGPPQAHWSSDGQRFFYVMTDRGHQRCRVFDVDALSGKARAIVDEQSQTFVNTYGGFYLFHNDTADELIWQSERDGWRHLYLYDRRTGKVKNQITKGDWVVRGVERVEQINRRIYFWAGGRSDNRDPYLKELYRIDWNGKNLTEMTPGHGQHSVQWSPDWNYYIDTYSRVDLQPVHEVRRTSDGKKMCDLEMADITDLIKSGWRIPEVFVAKGRDGKTDIWGNVYRPTKLDPAKKYPVLEHIYAGPHDAHVPKTFRTVHAGQALAELGFIVVMIDGMGTSQRSKAFHDVCWHNLKDAGFPDRIAWIKALAAKYPEVDANRVGIYGTSAGGQNAAGAVLFHGDFYKAAMAACGCHDNRIDKASWNEQWMGYPVGPHYANNSNITHADKLKGSLLLIVGELDTNVPPESTYRFADALIKAGKDFELLVVPGLGHSDGGPYGQRRTRDFFVRHLHGVPPPERNGGR